MLSALKEIELSNAVIIDTETTGVGQNDEIIELAIICADTGAVFFNEQFKPTVPVSDEAFAIHGISNEQLKDKPSFHSQLSGISDALYAEAVIGWRIDFDKRMIEQTSRAHGLYETKWYAQFVDLKAIYLKSRGFDADSVHLSTACEAEQIDMSDITAHRALDDCKMVYRLMNKILNEE